MDMTTGVLLDSQSLAYEEVVKLHVQKPDHPLLKYFLKPEEHHEEFLRKFGRRGVSPEDRHSLQNTDYAYEMYYLALRVANMDPDATILV